MIRSYYISTDSPGWTWVRRGVCWRGFPDRVSYI